MLKTILTHLSITHNTTTLVCASTGFVPSAELIKNANLIIENLKKYKCNSLLSDNAQMKVISKDDQDWIISDCMGRATKTGLVFLASVVSQYFFNNMAVKNILDTTSASKLENAYFDKFSGAQTWIIEKATPLSSK